MQALSFPSGMSQRGNISPFPLFRGVLSVAIKICGVFDEPDLFSFYSTHSSSDERILTMLVSVFSKRPIQIKDRSFKRKQ